MAKGKQIWVSNIIGNDYKTWRNEFVVLDCGTGCGKSYFCIRVLGKYAKAQGKSILYLCNRTKLRDKIFEEAKAQNLLQTIYVTSYQALKEKIQSNQALPYYDYIVADECHYFTTDAKFNDYTDVPYNYLIKQKDSVVLWVSATAKIFFKWLRDKTKVKKKNIYCIDKDYSYVNRVYFYKKDELTTIIDDILENETDSKIVVFCNSADRIIEMNKKYEDNAYYYCSNTSSSFRLKEVCGYDKKTKTIPDCIQKYNDDLITFEKKILFTTTVLDNGIDLKDIKIKHIFSEIFDVDSMIQSLGRKRSIDDADCCTFYIREFEQKAIQGLLNINNAQLEPADAYRNNYKEFFRTYGNGKRRCNLSKNRIFYSFFAEDKNLSKIKVNECRYRKYQHDNNILMKMKNEGYITILSQLIGEELSSKSEYIVVDVEQIDLFMEYLKSIEGKYLYFKDRERIKEEFEAIGVKLRYIGINTFNGALDDVYKELYTSRFYNKNESGKQLVDKRRKLSDDTENPNRDKTYWILKGGKILT